MPWPWPSFGNFLFKREETAHWESDVGWALAPSIAQTRPLGSSTDHIIATSIGSAVRSFELSLEQDRFLELQALLNTTDIFTDWLRPVPDSRLAFLSEVTPVEQVIHNSKVTRQDTRELRVKLTFVSQDPNLS